MTKPIRQSTGIVHSRRTATGGSTGRRRRALASATLNTMPISTTIASALPARSCASLVLRSAGGSVLRISPGAVAVGVGAEDGVAVLGTVVEVDAGAVVAVGAEVMVGVGWAAASAS